MSFTPAELVDEAKPNPAAESADDGTDDTDLTYLLGLIASLMDMLKVLEKRQAVYLLSDAETMDFAELMMEARNCLTDYEEEL